MFRDTNPYKILVIEDNPGDFLLISDYLEEHIAAPVIKQAHNFKEAEFLLRGKDCGFFNVVLLDLSLPDKKGEKLINDVIKITGNCPVIVLSGYADFEFSVRSLSLGISDYLLKDDLTSSSLYKSLLYNIERKKILTDLEEAKLRYSDLFHLSPQPMFVYEIETLKFLDVNQAAVNHYGYSSEEFLSMTIKDIRPKEDIPLLIEILEQSLENKEQYKQINSRHQTKDGRIIHIELQSNFIIFKEKEAKVILAHDITKRLKYSDHRKTKF